MRILIATPCYQQQINSMMVASLINCILFLEKQGHKIKYPCYIQPKLDGIRCIAMVQNGKCTLWSRTRKPITSCPHIVEELSRNFPVGNIVLDGELYNQDFRDNFEHIVHLVRQEEPDEKHRDVQYHVYDLVNSDAFKDRTEKLYHLIANHAFIDGNKRIGVLAMLTFFKMNNFNIHIQKDKLYDFAMDIAMSKISEDAVAKILKIIKYFFPNLLYDSK